MQVAGTGLHDADGGVVTAMEQVSGENAAKKMLPEFSEKVITCPLVGTVLFLRRLRTQRTIVKVGDTVKKGQVIGIVEAMKLMNEIESEYDGIVEEILVKNEETVEYGQPLFRIR
ncbi:MAG: acetyl-CoA carboxylase biotin carboxyl carrier protein [Roseburia sp.]